MFSVSPGLGCCVSTWNGDGSKPWYLVNIKIAAKWMFIPLKNFISRYWPIPKSINDSWEIHPLNWWKSWLSFHWTWPNFQAQARISLLLLCSIIEIKTPNKSRIQCFGVPKRLALLYPLVVQDDYEKSPMGKNGKMIQKKNNINFPVLIGKSNNYIILKNL